MLALSVALCRPTAREVERELHLAELSEQVGTMVSRASVVTLILAFCLISFVSAQVNQDRNPQSATSIIAALQGKVLAPDGRPLPGIHVEVDEASTAVPITSTYTQADGTFALYNIPKGSYEVVAESDDARVSDDVILQPERPSLELRFPGNTAASYSDPTISVARILVPESAKKLYRKAYAAFTQGKNDEAESLLNQALQIEPRFADALTLRGVLDMQKADLQEAQQYLESAIHIDSAYSPAYIALGAVYNHEGRFDDALRASERGIALSPRSWQAYFEMAKASVSAGMFQKALQFARQAQRLGGNGFASLHLVKACALYPMKLYKDARYEIQAVMTREPKGTSARQAQALLAEIDAAESPITVADAH